MDICPSNAGCQALLALVLQQGLPDETLRLVAARDFALLRSQETSTGTDVSARTDVPVPSASCFLHLNQFVDFYRAPQSASIAKSIQEEVSTVLSGEPGYRAATDAEFADLIWTGLSQGGSKVMAL